MNEWARGLGMPILACSMLYFDGPAPAPSPIAQNVAAANTQVCLVAGLALTSLVLSEALFRVWRYPVACGLLLLLNPAWTVSVEHGDCGMLRAAAANVFTWAATLVVAVQIVDGVVRSRLMARNSNMRRRLLVVGIPGLILGVGLGLYVYFFGYPTWREPELRLPVGTVAVSPEDLDVYEAVLRYQIFNSAAAGRGTVPAYVQIRNLNPPPEFLERFRGHKPPVRAAERFRRGGVLYFLDAIKRTGEEAAEVDGGYYEGNLSGSDNTYYLIRKDGSWKVIRDVEHSISQSPPVHLPRTTG